MRQVNVHDILSKAKFNAFFLFIWTVCFACMFFDGYDAQLYGVAMPTMAAQLDFGPEVAGILGSANFWGAFVGAIICGFLTDKLGRKKMLVAAIVVFSIFTALCATVNENMILFYAYRFLAGAAIAIVPPVTVALISEYSPAKNRRFLLVANGCGLTLGMMLGGVIGRFILPIFGWQVLFATAIIGLACIPFILKLPETMVAYRLKGETDRIKKILVKADSNFVPKDDDEYIIHQTEVVNTSVTELFKNGLARNTILIWILAFLNMFVIAAMQTWLPQLGVIIGFDVSDVPTLIIIMSSGMFVGHFIWGLISNKIGYKKSLIICYLCIALFLILMTVGGGEVFFGVALFFYGVSQATMALTQPFTASNYPISIRGTGLGMHEAAKRVGGMVSPIVIGVLVGAGLGAPDVFRFLAAVAILGLVTLLLTKALRFDADKKYD